MFAFTVFENMGLALLLLLFGLGLLAKKLSGSGLARQAARKGIAHWLRRMM